MKARNAIVIVIVFLLGIVAGNAYNGMEEAFNSPVYTDGYELPTQIYTGITGKAIERLSPSDHVSENQLYVDKEKAILMIPNLVYAKFPNSDSMDPVIDEHANALEVVPQNEADIEEGDIVAYQNSCTEDATVIHRIVKKSEDQLGTFYIVRGDNNAAADPCPVRFDEIKSVVVGIIY